MERWLGYGLGVLTKTRIEVNKKVLRNYVAKHARQQQRAVTMKDRKREAKKTGQHGKRRLANEAPFFCRLFHG